MKRRSNVSFRTALHITLSISIGWAPLAQADAWPNSNYPEAKPEATSQAGEAYPGPIPKDKSPTVVPDQGVQNHDNSIDRWRYVPRSRSKALVPVPGEGVTNPEDKFDRTGDTTVKRGRKVRWENWDKYNPEQLDATLGWSDADKAEAKEQLETLFEQDTLSFKLKQSLKAVPGKLAETYKGGASAIPAGVAAFYGAIGVTGAVLAYGAHSTHPVEIANTKNLMASAPLALSIVGFAAVSYPFMKPNPAVSIWKGPLRFGAGMGLGMVVSTSMYIVASDPDMQACAKSIMPFLNDGQWIDKNACNLAWKRYTAFNADYLMKTFAPMLATGLVASMLYPGLPAAGGLIFSKLGMEKTAQIVGMQFIRGARGGRIPNLLMGAAGTILFMSAFDFANGVFGIEHMVNEKLVTNFRFNKSDYGADISGAEESFFREWSKLRKNHFVDDMTYCQWNELGCQKAVSLEPAIYNLAEKLGEWRATQMDETFDAYKQWVQKVAAFDTTRQLSYSMYKDAVGQIAKIRQGQSTENLNAKWIDSYAEAIKKSTPEIQKNPPATALGKAQTYSTSDFIIASMACGPEVQYPTPDSRGVVRKIFDKVTFQGNPSGIQSSVDRGASVLTPGTDSVPASFHPPRLTEPKGANISACDYAENETTPRALLINSKFIEDQSRLKGFSVLPVIGSPMTLVEYIQRDLRSDILSADGRQNNFDAWWENFVEKDVKDAGRYFQAEYRDGVLGTFLKALGKRDSYCFNSFDSSPYKQLMQGWDRADVCGGGSGAGTYKRYLAKGIFDNIRDEAHLFFGLFKDILANHGDKGADNDGFFNSLSMTKKVAKAEELLNGKKNTEAKKPAVAKTPTLVDVQLAPTEKDTFVSGQVDDLERAFGKLLIVDKVVKGDMTYKNDLQDYDKQVDSLKKLLEQAMPKSGTTDAVKEYKKKLALSALNVIGLLKDEVTRYFDLMNQPMVPDLDR